MAGFVLGIDQGTSGSRALVLDGDGAVRGYGYRPLARLHPGPDCVEQDPLAVAAGVREAIAEALGRAGIRPTDVAACGIASQRDTDFVWDARTGEPLANAITWQDLRTIPLEDASRAWPLAAECRYRLGYWPGPWSGALHLKWRMRERPGRPGRRAAGTLRIGPSASWVLAALGGDPASRGRRLAGPDASTCGTSGRATGGTRGSPTSASRGPPSARRRRPLPTSGRSTSRGRRVPGARHDRRPAGRPLRVRLPRRRRRRGDPRDGLVRERLPGRRRAGARHDQGLPGLAARRPADLLPGGRHHGRPAPRSAGCERGPGSSPATRSSGSSPSPVPDAAGLASCRPSRASTSPTTCGRRAARSLGLTLGHTRAHIARRVPRSRSASRSGRSSTRSTPGPACGWPDSRSAAGSRPATPPVPSRPTGSGSPSCAPPSRRRPPGRRPCWPAWAPGSGAGADLPPLPGETRVFEPRIDAGRRAEGRAAWQRAVDAVTGWAASEG